MSLKFDMAALVLVGVSAAGGLVSWGMNSSRLVSLESRAAVQSQRAQEIDLKVDQHTTSIAVEGQKLDDILRRLERIENKIDAKK